MQSSEVDLTGFKSVSFEFGQIHIKGGFLGKPMPMVSKQFRSGDDEQTKTFVKISRDQPWLMAATAGKNKASHTSIGRTSLLNMLHDKVEQFANGKLESCSSDGATHGGGDEAADDDDPMNMVDVPVEEQQKFETPTKVSGRGSNRQRYYRNVAKGTIFYTNVPECTAEEDPTQREQRRIALYILDRRTIWLDLDDVAWAVRFLYVQNMLKGVPVVQADDDGPGGGQHRGDGESPSASNPKRARISESPIRGDKSFQRKKSFCDDGESQVLL